MKQKALTQGRALYAELVAQQGQGKTFGKNTIITESFLRFEVPLTSSQVFAFNVQENQGLQTTSTERRLKSSDAFIVNKWGLFLKKTTATVSNGQAKLFTYPEPTVFSGSDEAANLEEIYNGSFTVKIDQTTWFDAIDNLRFKRVTEAQQGLAVSTAASNNAYKNSGFADADFGFGTLQPSIKLDGSSSNEIYITLPESKNLNPTANEQNYAVLIVRGYLIQRGAANMPK